MSTPIADYALIGDTHAAGLVSRSGSIDWLCVPRFDSTACFAALLGDETNGLWSIRPLGDDATVSRRYRGETLVLETTFETADGVVRVTDCMSPRPGHPDVVRLVECISGSVTMVMEMAPRFDYGGVLPWVSEGEGGLVAVGGPDALFLRCPVATEVRHGTVSARFDVAAGEQVAFELIWHASYESTPLPEADLPPEDVVRSTVEWWEDWSGRCTYDGDHREVVIRSLITLKALTYAPSGGIVAAATTSLPELVGGPKNWDYRFCWVRDATFTLYALLVGGYVDEAEAWRDWLLRAVAGDPSQLNLMYGVGGERRLPELEIPWLPGWSGSSPVRVGNAAAVQFQLDVYGELMDAVHQARQAGMEPDERAGDVMARLLEFLESAWQEPDHGIWEFRSEPRHYTHSKVMAWVAFDRGIKVLAGNVADEVIERWSTCRDAVRDEVCERGWNDDAGCFTQTYGSSTPDASLLMVPLVGFLPPDDDRVRSTVEVIQRELCRDGFVLRHPADASGRRDDLPAEEGTFVACTLWLADCLQLMGRHDEAVHLFERVLATCNDLGLLSEQYDPDSDQMLGNFPQAFSHVGLVNTARNLSRPGGPGEQREHR